jgi:hypothetical protein
MPTLARVPSPKSTRFPPLKLRTSAHTLTMGLMTFETGSCSGQISIFASAGERLDVGWAIDVLHPLAR